MNEFRNILSKLIKEILQGFLSVKEESIKELQTCYGNMNLRERGVCLKSVLQFTNNDLKTYVFLLSFMLKYLNDEQIKNAIEDALENEQFPLLDSIIFSRQLNTQCFFNRMTFNAYEEYERKKRIHERHVKEVRESMTEKFSYVPFEQRNRKRVVLVIDQILDEYHAPTKELVNIYFYFQQIGYEVLAVATNYKGMEFSRLYQWWNMICDNSRYNETGQFIQNFMGIEVHGYHIAYTDESFIESLQAAVELIKEYNPAFVMMIGDRGILADLCNDFTMVVTMACVNKPAVTTAPIIVRYFDCTDEQEEEYQRCLQNKRILEFRHINELQPYTDEVLTREQFGMTEDDFVIVIVGNRLDDEVSEATKKVLFQILDENPSVVVAFIGICEKLEASFNKTSYAQRFRYMGYQSNFREAIGLGDIFLNPPRQGGGTGGSIAVAKGVPVVTLDNCDIARVGKEFICESLEDMPKLVKRYITDSDYMQKQKAFCRISANKIYGVDSVENLKKLCTEIENEIYRMEKYR